MKAQWLDKAWYLAFWILVFVAARLWLINPILDELRRLKGD